jgi:DNA sulfur modification protein DndD
MLLRSLTLSNVGVYRGTQQVCFATDSDQPVTLIGGRNGTGKTSLLQAIPLGLYGNRARWILNGVSYPDHLNSLIHHGAHTASIMLEFDRAEAGQQVRYTVERSWHRTRHRKASDRLTVSANGEPRPDLAAGWAEFAEGIMPVAVAELAIFDGEKIESLADPASSTEVLRTSIYGLLGLGLIDRLRTDLRDFRRRAAKAHKSRQPDLLTQAITEAETELTEAQSDADAARVALSDAQAARADLQAQLHKANDKLATTGGELLAQRDDIHRCLAEAAAASAAIERELRQVAASELPLGLVPDLVKLTVAAGEQHEASRLAQQTYSAMSERDARVAERLIAELGLHATHADLLRGLLRSDLGSLPRPDPPSFSPTLECTEAARSLLHHRLSDLQATAKRLGRQFDEHNDDIERLDAMLAAVPDATSVAAVVRSVATAEAELQVADKSLERASHAVAAADRRVMDAQRRVDVLAHEALDVETAEQNTARTAREITAADEVLEQFAHHMVSKHLNRITTEINSALAVLLRKQGLVTSVFIDPDDLSVALVGSRRQRVDPHRLSAGERQMMATGILWGLSRCTGMTLPTVIDAPLGRLDQTHRKNLIERYFPNASRQVVLLSTDEEIAGDHLRRLQPSVGAQYRLDFNETDACTTIREGYLDG